MLRAAGATVENFLPHRLEEGYGLSADGVARCRQELRPQLLLTVDCGTTSLEPLAEAKRLGLDVVVITAYATVETAVEAMRLGACDYLNKPFDIPTMGESVQKATSLCARAAFSRRWVTRSG